MGLAQITVGAPPSPRLCLGGGGRKKKRRWFKINVIICHRKPIWLLSLCPCTNVTARAPACICACGFHLASPARLENGHLVFSSSPSRTLGRAKIWLVYTKYLAAFGRQSVCPHQTIDWVSPQWQRRRKTTPLIVVTSVFAQPDSQSEEPLKCGVRPFWVFFCQKSTTLTVSFRLSRRCSVTAESCTYVRVEETASWNVGLAAFEGADSNLLLPISHVNSQ